MTLVSVSVAAMADVGDHDAGLASGLMTAAHELGAAIGVAVLASIAAAGSGHCRRVRGRIRRGERGRHGHGARHRDRAADRAAGSGRGTLDPLACAHR
jgi:hypothetical protein